MTNAVPIIEVTSPAAAVFSAILPWVLIIALLMFILWLLPTVQNHVSTVNPVVLDGLLITFTAAFIFSQNFFGSDEVYKYVSPGAVFWLKYGFGLGATSALALKGFRYGLPNTGNTPPKPPEIPVDVKPTVG